LQSFPIISEDAAPWATSLITLVVAKFIPVPHVLPFPKVYQLPLKAIRRVEDEARTMVMFKNQFREVVLELVIVICEVPPK